MSRVLIVDDHPAIRMAVGIVLKNKGHYICGEFDNGVDALDMIRKDTPDVVILDINIPRIDGFDVIKRCHDLPNRPKIVVLSAHDSDHIKSRCLQLGASAFLSKLDDLTLMADLVERVLSGYIIFDYDIHFDVKKENGSNNKSILNKLSTREISVLMALVRGDSNKKIASDLVLSEKTISTYKSRLMDKLNIDNIVELIDFAKRNGLV